MRIDSELNIVVFNSFCQKEMMEKSPTAKEQKEGSMNFDFLRPLTIIRPFYVFCSDAEEYALSKPDISCASAQKAIEYIVRLMYTAAIQTEANQLTVYDMLCSPDFVIYLDDRTLLNAIHLIRRKGNLAVHQGGLTESDSREVVEQLHYVAGEVCIFLGLLGDYPPFDSSLLSSDKKTNPAQQNPFSEEEPSVEEEIIRGFEKRLKSVQHYSQLRSQRAFIDIHVNTAKYDELEKEKGKEARINTSSNSRAAFAMIANWIREQLPSFRITEDNRLLAITVYTGEKQVRIVVKMGCTGLGTRDSSGEWNLLPGVDYVFYCFDIDLKQQILQQFHVFTKNEFLQMWKNLKLIIPKISPAAHKRLRAIYGNDMVFSTEEHADIMSVQVFKTSRKKTQMFEEEFAKKPALSEEILKSIIK